MASLIAPVVGIAGSLIGGLGGKSQQTQNQNSTSTTKGTQTANTNQLNQAIEDPQFAAFREALLPAILGLVQKSTQPVYTDSKVAGTLADINKQFGHQDINPAMAGRGLLNSGATAALHANQDNARSATASNFFTQLPFLEQQAQMTNLTNALGLAANFAGRAPISQQVTGNTTQTTDQTTNQTGQMTGNNGQGFGSSFANNLGGFIGGGGFNNVNWGGLGGGNKGQNSINFGNNSNTQWGPN